MPYQNVKVKPRQTVTQPNTQTERLGITTNVPMGEWNATTPYMKLNMVRSHGATYQAKRNNQGVEPTVTTGWQEIWQPVAYDGLVTPVGNYPEMMVGNATNAQNDGNGENIAEQFADINNKIPSTASAENQLADKAFVNSSINNFAAFYIEYNVQGDAFPTRAALLGATTFYNAGQPRVPTQNDYAYVLADESQPKDSLGNYPTTRYSYQGGTYPNGQWGFQYIVNNTSLTQAQIDAINSGITVQKITEMEEATAAKYTKPASGIPEDDLSASVQNKLNSSTTVDSALSATSTNPVQNKVVTVALSDGSVTKVGTSDIGNSTKPMYLNGGIPTACSREIPSITLNGTSTTTPSFYAPTSVGNAYNLSLRWDTTTNKPVFGKTLSNITTLFSSNAVTTGTKTYTAANQYSCIYVSVVFGGTAAQKKYVERLIPYELWKDLYDSSVYPIGFFTDVSWLVLKPSSNTSFNITEVSTASGTKPSELYIYGVN